MSDPSEARRKELKKRFAADAKAANKPSPHEARRREELKAVFAKASAGNEVEAKVPDDAEGDDPGPKSTSKKSSKSSKKS